MTEKITVEEYRKLSKKGLKYGNKITKYKGMTFHSKGECDRWKELELLQIAREISDLKRQTKHFFKFEYDGLVVGTYTDDYSYYERYSEPFGPFFRGSKIKERFVIEDFKGAETDLFKLKWNLMHIIYKSSIEEGSVVLRITSKGRS